MSLLLAQITVTDHEFYVFCGCLALVLGAVLAVKKLFTHDPALHKAYTSQEQHAELKTHVAAIETKVDEGFRHLDQKRSVSIAGLHEHVRLQGNDIASLKSETGSQTRQLHAHGEKLDRILERLAKIRAN